jgi:hypothetical protein
MAKRTVKTEPSREELLKEYEFCQKAAQSMESTIWQTAAAMSIGLVGSFLLVTLRAADDQPPWYVACLVGPFMTVIALIWLLIARRWWSVQHSMFMRMRHIEKRLGIHSTWYLQYLDHPELLQDSGLSAEEIASLAKRSTTRDRIGIRRHQHWGVQATLWLLPVVLLVGWAIYSFVLFIAQVFGAA